MNTRDKGLKYLEDCLGKLPTEHITVSKYYFSNESWTQSPIWWFDIPLNRLESPNEFVHIICLKIGEGFFYLCVPTEYFTLNFKNFYSNDKKITLYISAQEDNKFQDLKGPGSMSFSNWLQD